MERPQQKTRSLNAQLAQTVKRLRLEKGLSQEELASLANVDRTYISGIERARRNITIATLERLIPHLCNGSVEFFEELKTQIQKTIQDADTTTRLPLPESYPEASLPRVASH